MWTLVEQAPHKQDHGQLVAPVGEHIKSGETEIEALIREAQEEIGVDRLEHNHLGSAVFRRTITGRDENHMFEVFEISPSQKIVLGEESVSMKSFSEYELRNTLLNSPASFGDGYYFVLEHFYPDYLPKRYKFRWAMR